VQVDLSQQSATSGYGFGGNAEGDKYYGIENIKGSNIDISGPGDELIGDEQANQLFGLAGDDTLYGGLGSDLLDGGLGLDTASFVNENSGVYVNLDLGKATQGHYTTEFIAFKYPSPITSHLYDVTIIDTKESIEFPVPLYVGLASLPKKDLEDIVKGKILESDRILELFRSSGFPFDGDRYKISTNKESGLNERKIAQALDLNDIKFGSYSSYIDYQQVSDADLISGLISEKNADLMPN
jgi:hypothetical protein